MPPEEAAHQEANPQLQPQPSCRAGSGEGQRGGQDPRGVGGNLLQDLQVGRGVRVEDLLIRAGRARQNRRPQTLHGHQSQEQRVPAGLLLCRSLGEPGQRELQGAHHQNPLHLPGGERGGRVTEPSGAARDAAGFFSWGGWSGCGDGWKDAGVNR